MDNKEDFIESAMDGIAFDENGLPITGSQSNDRNETIIPLKRGESDSGVNGQFVITSESIMANTKIKQPVESTDEQIFKSIIRRTKKQPMTITVNHIMVTVDPAVLAVINDSIQCETDDDKIELLFEEIYDQQEVKRKIFEKFKEVYKKQD